MVEDGFSSTELDDLTRALFRTAEKIYPKEAKKMLRKQGSVGRKKLRENTKSVTGKKTGNLLKGIKHGKVYQYKNGDFQIRVKNTAPHAHLIEYGHSNIKTMKSAGSSGKIPVGSPVQMVPAENGPIFVRGEKEKLIPGKYPARKTAEEMKLIFPEAVEEFVDKMLEEGLSL